MKKNFLNSALLLSAAVAATPALAWKVDGHNRMSFGGNIRVGAQYALEPKNGTENNDKEGFTIVQNKSDLFFKSHAHLGKGNVVYMMYDQGFNPASGEIQTNNVFSAEPTYLFFLGFKSGAFDTQMGTVESIPYRYVGNYSDIGFGSGGDRTSNGASYPANHRIPRALISTYTYKNFEAGLDLQLTGTSADTAAGGVGNNISVYSGALGLKYANDMASVGVAYNMMPNDVTAQPGDGYSAQSNTFNTMGSRPGYFGVGGSVKVKVKNISRAEIFGTYNFMDRSRDLGNLTTVGVNTTTSPQNAANGVQATGAGITDQRVAADSQLYTDPTTLPPNVDQSGFSRTSYSIGFRSYGWQFQYESGMLNKHADAVTVNYKYPLAKNVNVRAEAYYPSSLVALSNAAGALMQGQHTDTYKVDLEYSF